MFSLSVLAFSILPISNALSISTTSVSAVHSPVPTGTPADANVPVLGPVSQLYIANNYVAPDGYNRS